MKKNINWWVFIVVILWVFIWVFIMLWMLQILYNLDKQDKNTIDFLDIYEEIDKEQLYFKNLLIKTNTDWDWYLTDWWSQVDISWDDDDFNSWNRWYFDNDLDAFNTRYWDILWDKQDVNILAIDNETKRINNFNINSLSNLLIYTTNNSKLSIVLLDWDKYDNFWKFIIKNQKNYNINWESKIEFKTDFTKDFITISQNDIILFFLSNNLDDINYYSLNLFDENNEKLYFIPALNKEDNIDFYWVLYKKEKEQFYRYDKYFDNILTYGKKPISPTFLRKEAISNSWTTLELAWDINDFYNTWNLYLFKSTNNILDCDENTYFQKIAYTWSSIDIEYFPWNYYTICSSKHINSWSWIIFSTKSNVLYVE